MTRVKCRASDAPSSLCFLRLVFFVLFCLFVALYSLPAPGSLPDITLCHLRPCTEVRTSSQHVCNKRLLLRALASLWANICRRTSWRLPAPKGLKSELL